MAVAVAAGRDHVVVLDDRAALLGQRSDDDQRPTPCATATSTSSTATSGSPPTPRRPTSCCDGGDQSRQPTAQGGVVLHHPEGHARMPHRPQRLQHAPPVSRAISVRAVTPRSSSRTAGFRSANRVGGEGDGFVLAQKRLNGGRIHHAMRWVGQCNKAFDLMCERAVSRSTKGQLLIEKQMIQDLIAESSAEIRALRLMALHSAWVWDTQGGSKARIEIAELKFWGAKVLQQRDRPGHPGPWRARLDHRSAAGEDVRHGPPDAHRRRRRRSAQVVRGRRKRAKDYTPVEGWPSQHIPTLKAKHRARFEAYLDNEVLNDGHP